MILVPCQRAPSRPGARDTAALELPIGSQREILPRRAHLGKFQGLWIVKARRLHAAAVETPGSHNGGGRRCGLYKCTGRAGCAAQRQGKKRNDAFHGTEDEPPAHLVIYITA